MAGRSFSACRVFREPAFPYALFLLEELEDGPEGREGDDPADCRPGETVAAEQYGEHEEEDAGQEKNPPASFPEMIFSLDYQRVEQAYYQECTETDYNASEIIKIHNQNFSLQIYAEAERRANFICYAEAPAEAPQYMWTRSVQISQKPSAEQILFAMPRRGRGATVYAAVSSAPQPRPGRQNGWNARRARRGNRSILKYVRISGPEAQRRRPPVFTPRLKHSYEARPKRNSPQNT